MELRGPWDRRQVERYLLDTAIPLRLAFLAADGTPHLASHWYLHRDDALWCASQGGSYTIRRLAEDPRCGFEVAGDEPPYRGVRGRGRATLVPDAGGETLVALIERYLGDTRSSLARWLLARREGEVAVRIVPELIVSWDYSERMS